MVIKPVFSSVGRDTTSNPFMFGTEVRLNGREQIGELGFKRFY